MIVGRTKKDDFIVIPPKLTQNKRYRPFKRVKVFDNKTGILLKTYPSVADTVKNMPFSNAVFNKVMRTNKIWNNYRFEFEDGKTSF